MHPPSHSSIHYHLLSTKHLSVETSIFFKNINTVKVKQSPNAFFPKEKATLSIINFVHFLCLRKSTDHCSHLNFTKLAKLASFLPRSLYDKPTMISIISLSRYRVIYSMNHPISSDISDTLSVM